MVLINILKVKGEEMKKFIFTLFFIMSIVGFSNCIPSKDWGTTMVDVVVFKKGVPVQYHTGHIPKVLTRMNRVNGVWNSTMYITFVPVGELYKYRNNPEQLPYFTLKFVQCNY